MKIPQMPTPKNPEKGFTLIELMIVIAIIAILVAIALPAYQTYIRKATFSEVINAASPAKAAISAWGQEQGKLDDFKGAGYAQGSVGSVSGIAVTDGTATGGAVITVTSESTANGLHSDIAGKTVVLTPTIDGDGNVEWACTSTAAQKYLPSFCTG